MTRSRRDLARPARPALVLGSLVLAVGWTGCGGDGATPGADAADTGVSGACEAGDLPFDVVVSGELVSPDEETACGSLGRAACEETLVVTVAGSQSALEAVFEVELPGLTPPSVDFGAWQAAVAYIPLRGHAENDLQVDRVSADGNTLLVQATNRVPADAPDVVTRPYVVLAVPTGCASATGDLDLAHDTGG